MIQTKGYAAYDPTSDLKPYDFERREVGPNDVKIDILFCGICHSDLHHVKGEWGDIIYPSVPGHEIVGRIVQVGPEVKKFKEGDLAGVGCFVDSCRHCHSCREGLEQYCENGFVATYGGIGKDGITPTQGGYSSNIIVVS